MGFFDVITHMDETIIAAKSKETVLSGILRVGSLLLVIGILMGLYFQLTPELAAEQPLPPIISMPLLLLVGGLVVSLLMNFLSWSGARIMGGKGTFGEHYGTASLITWPATIIQVIAIGIFALLALTQVLPLLVIGLIILVMTVLVMLFASSYFVITVVKEVHDFSTYKTFLHFLLLTMITIVMVYLLVVVMLMVIGLYAAPIIGSQIPPEYL